MVTLSNQQPLSASNDQNNVAFKQLNTGNYELQKIQKNVQEALAGVSQNISKAIAIVAIITAAATYAVDPATAPRQLLFPKVSGNTLQTYNDSTFTAPQSGIYLLSFQGIFKVTGAPTSVSVVASSNTQGTLITFTAPVSATLAQVIFSVLVSLKSNENVVFQVNADGIGSVTLDPPASIGVSLAA